MSDFYLAMVLAAMALAVIFMVLSHGLQQNISPDLKWGRYIVFGCAAIAGLSLLALPVIAVFGFVAWGSQL